MKYNRIKITCCCKAFEKEVRALVDKEKKEGIKEAYKKLNR